jgi:hypothetical protein
MVCSHEQCFSVSEVTAASDTAQKIGLFASLDAAVASNTEKHCLCKQTTYIGIAFLTKQKVVLAAAWHPEHRRNRKP